MKFIYANYYYNFKFNVTCITEKYNDINRKGRFLLKSPNHKWSKYEKKRQSLDELRSLDWEIAEGLGVVLGFKKLRALDIDGCSDQNLIQDFLRILGLPLDYGWVTESGSKNGFHIIFFAEDHDYKVAKGKIKVFGPSIKFKKKFKHIELRWRGHLVLPPSKHPSLMNYQFINGFPIDLPLKIELIDLDNLLVKHCSGKSIKKKINKTYKDLNIEKHSSVDKLITEIKASGSGLHLDLDEEDDIKASGSGLHLDLDEEDDIKASGSGLHLDLDEEDDIKASGSGLHLDLDEEDDIKASGSGLHLDLDEEDDIKASESGLHLDLDEEDDIKASGSGLHLDLDEEDDIKASGSGLHLDLDEESETDLEYNFKDEEGNIYIGEWSGDRMSGKGSLIFISGNKLEGNWEKGIFIKGYFISKKGARYPLEFKVYHSRWTTEYDHSIELNDSYLKDNPKYNGPLGTAYTQDDLAEGKFTASFYWQNGDSYHGLWKDDLPNGKGRFSYGDGRIYKGKWIDGVLNGEVEFQDNDGSKYQGRYVNGKRDGIGFFINANGHKYLETYKEGIKLTTTYIQEEKSASIFEEDKITSEVKDEEKQYLLQKVNYKLNFENISHYPITHIPLFGAVIRSHRYGKSNIRGFKEASFQSLIEKYFGFDFEVSGEVRINTGDQTRPYEPDIALIDNTSKFSIRIDIEIDEPYSGIGRQPTHCEGDDASRDLYFKDRGWIVIRFSEYQVHAKPFACLRYIADLIKSIDKDYVIVSDLLDIEPLELNDESLWDELQAQIWEKESYREKYLDHEFKLVSENHSNIDSDLNSHEIMEENNVISSQHLDYYVPSSIGFNKVNKLSRDQRINFNAASHSYWIDKVPAQPASAIISRFFPVFDSYAVAENLSPSNSLYGLDVEEIVGIWKNRGLESAKAGTFLHEQIENYLLDKPYSNSDEFQLFLDFMNDHPELNAYRTEWRIFDEEYNVAGTVDFVTEHDGKYEIYDWKRSKKVIDRYTEGINFDNWGKYGLGELSDLKDISYNRYCLQQNLYKYILEKNYGMIIDKMYLVILHPEYEKYYKVEVPEMEDFIAAILASLRSK